MIDKKLKKLIELALKGGNNADLFVLNEIQEIKSDLEKIQTAIQEMESRTPDEENFTVNIHNDNTETIEDLKTKLAELVQKIDDFPNHTEKFTSIEDKLKDVEAQKNIVEVKETIIEREVISNEKIEEIKSLIPIERTDEQIARGLEELEEEEKLSFNALKDVPNIQEIKDAISVLHARASGGGNIEVFNSTGNKVGSGSGIQFQGSGVSSITNNGNKTIVTIEGGAGSSISVNGAEVTDPDFINGDTLEFDASGSNVTGNVIGVNRIVVSANTTAVLGRFYISVATAIYTDPTPAPGKGFTVFVRNGTATVGGTAYATAGTLIYRYYHSGAWANYVYGNIDGSGTANQLTYWLDSDTIGSLTTATYPSLTELSYVKGVTSSIQTQLNGKASDIRPVGYRVLAPTSSTIGDSATALGGDLEVPFTGTITKVVAYNDTAGTTGTATYDIHLNGTTIMTTTKISIETGEKSSRNATTQPVLTTTSVTEGDILTFFCDTAQSGTPARGLSFAVYIQE